MKKFFITFPGEPITKANQTKFAWSRKKRRAMVHIPDKFVDYEEAIKEAGLKVIKKHPHLKLDYGPVEIHIDYYLQSRRRKDLLNLPKTTCDALNDVAYKDDSQIVKATLNKYYDKDNPRVEVTVSRPYSWKKNWLAGLWPLTLSKKIKKLISK